ncbi:MAG: BolA family transcriptional regulator [Deltaproteobacteria bacterium]|nr:BolA family transcriptional regulator [Deltaproteobacteria bacterium]
MKEKLKEILSLRFNPLFLEVLDQSHQHRGHAGVKKGGGGHYEVTLVSGVFTDLLPLERHRLVYASLEEYFGETIKSPREKIHALALTLLSPEEWKSQT